MRTTNVLVLEQGDLKLLQVARDAMTAAIEALAERTAMQVAEPEVAAPVKRAAQPTRRVAKARKAKRGRSTNPAAVAARKRRAAAKKAAAPETAPTAQAPTVESAGKKYDPTAVPTAPAAGAAEE